MPEMEIKELRARLTQAAMQRSPGGPISEAFFRWVNVLSRSGRRIHRIALRSDLFVLLREESLGCFSVRSVLNCLDSSYSMRCPWGPMLIERRPS